MKTAVILNSFGTTTAAEQTYVHLEHALRNALPQFEFYRAYSSREIRRRLQERRLLPYANLAELLQQLSRQSTHNAIVQSLHLFPGKEFHSLLLSLKTSPIPCSLGMPLLTTPEDYCQLADILQPTITSHRDQAILILGHGTTHPSWTGYYSLEKIFREIFGDRIFVGVIEKHPDSSGLIDQLHTEGFRSVCIIPLFLVAGMHFQRDIAGTGEHTWATRLRRRGLQVACIDYGIGLYPGIEALITRHILEAFAGLSAKDDPNTARYCSTR
jgi:sirohydrochlorin cobaltochelatase